MDFKIKIVCKCECAFELRSENYSPHSAIICPNCGSSLPADIVEKINIGLAALSSIPRQLGADDALFELPSFVLSVEHFSAFDRITNNQN